MYHKILFFSRGDTLLVTNLVTTMDVNMIAAIPATQLSTLTAIKIQTPPSALSCPTTARAVVRGFRTFRLLPRRSSWTATPSLLEPPQKTVLASTTKSDLQWLLIGLLQPHAISIPSATMETHPRTIFAMVESAFSLPA